MVEVLTGLISGIISGMGMGGGTVLILCLSIFLGVNQKIAQGVNLIFFIPTSIAAIAVNIKEKNINFKIAKIVIAFAIIGAVVGAIIARTINVNLLRKLFGIFLGFIAIHEIYILIKEYKTSKKRDNNKKQV